MLGKVFIHLGLHKTASTWLQEKIFTQYDDLLLLTRPLTTQVAPFNKLQFANDYIYDEQELIEVVRHYHEQYPERNILISDEALSGLPRYNYLNRSQIAERLRSAFPEAEVLIFLRGQYDLVKSLHAQSIRSGWNAFGLTEDFIWEPKQAYSLDWYLNADADFDLEAFYVNYFAQLHWDHFDYHQLIDYYRQLFPSVHVLLYEELRENPDGIINKLNQIFGTDARIKVSQEIVNKKLNRFRHYQHLVSGLVNRLGVRAKWYTRSLTALLLPFVWLKSRLDKPLPRRAFARHFAESNQALARANPEIGIQRYRKQYFLE